MDKEVAKDNLKADIKYWENTSVSVDHLYMAINAIEKLEQINQIVEDHDNDSMPEDYWYIDKIREVLEQE